LPISFGFGEDLTKIADTFFEDLHTIYALNRAEPARRFELLNVCRSENTFRIIVVRENETNSEINVRKHRNLTF